MSDSTNFQMAEKLQRKTLAITYGEVFNSLLDPIEIVKVPTP